MRRFFEQAWEEKGHIAWILAPLSLLYQFGWRAYLAIYQSGIKKPYMPRVPTICVGNCTAGGSGKTPFTLWLAETLTARGHSIVLSTSGYGSPHYKGAAITPQGILDVKEWGDESSMFRELLPDLPLIVGHDRVLAAQLAAQNYPDHILLMDDGFQHLRIKPQISLLIEPLLENDFCFPAGPYREPPSLGEKRATRTLTYESDIHPLPLDAKTLNGKPLPKKTTVQLLCAIAHPSRLTNSLQVAGFHVKYTQIQPDHDPLDAGNLLESIDPKYPLVVTAKDYVKLKNHPDLHRFQVVIVNYRVAPRNPDAFFTWIESKINECRKESIPG